METGRQDDHRGGWQTNTLLRGMLRNVFVRSKFTKIEELREVQGVYASRTHVNRTRVGAKNRTPSTCGGTGCIHPSMATLIF